MLHALYSHQYYFQEELEGLHAVLGVHQEELEGHEV